MIGNGCMSRLIAQRVLDGSLLIPLNLTHPLKSVWVATVEVDTIHFLRNGNVCIQVAWSYNERTSHLLQAASWFYVVTPPGIGPKCVTRARATYPMLSFAVTNAWQNVGNVEQWEAPTTTCFQQNGHWTSRHKMTLHNPKVFARWLAWRKYYTQYDVRRRQSDYFGWHWTTSCEERHLICQLIHQKPYTPL